MKRARSLDRTRALRTRPLMLSERVASPVASVAEALEGEMPHRADTPMVDVRDVAAAHIAAAETPAAANKRFLLSSSMTIPRARVLALLAAHHPELLVADGGAQPDPSTMRELFCSKNTLPTLGLTLRNIDDSLLDMAEAMLTFGVVQPKLRAEAAPHEEL